MLTVLSRVGGVGDGLFVIFFFLALSVLICAVGMRTDRPRSVTKMRRISAV
jgi:K+-transporting ATPase A subunit